MNGTWTQLHDRHGNTWELGDEIMIVCRPSSTYRGVLEEILPHYITVDGCGFPVEDILTIESP